MMTFAAFAALFGAVIGGFLSVVASVLAQRVQARSQWMVQEFKQRQHLLCENRTACAGHTQCDDLWIAFCHLLSRIVQSRSGPGASQGRAKAFCGDRIFWRRKR